MRRLILVRHGHTDGGNARCTGHTDIPLSKAGVEAIERLTREQLAGMSPVRVVSSDLRRAADSAAIIANALGARIEYDARLREMHFGEWDGRLWSDIEKTDGDRCAAWMRDWVDVATPGGESTRDLLARAQRWLDANREVSETTIAVAHAGWIRAVVTLTRGMSPARLFEITIEPAAAIVLDLD